MRFSKRSVIISLLSAFVMIVASANSYMPQASKSGSISRFIFKPKLSDYHIFSGKPGNLIPEAGFHNYMLATTLFTDYAQKQRLIKLPPGTKMTKIDDGLLNFPDGTIIVKTFYYQADERDSLLRLKIIETRLLIKTNGQWQAADYKWNNDQNDAKLFPAGGTEPVTWVDKNGISRSIFYDIPSKGHCAACHNSAGVLLPIGPKVSNLNFNISAGGKMQNQLETFQKMGILEKFDVQQCTSLPRAFDPDFSIAEQARAYMEVNCAHCHNPKGLAKITGLYLSYALPLYQTNIIRYQKRILRKTQNHTMPLLGTTIVHTEGVELIKKYIADLNKPGFSTH